MARQLAKTLKAYIFKHCSAGDRLPPERELARRYKRSVTTVRGALGFLAAEGFVERKIGSGTYVTGVLAQRTGATALIYFGAGVGGGIAALAAAPDGTLIVGSSGAVAGLFGAWVAVRFRAARYEEITWRARVRALGVGMLVLPALLNPMTPTGQPISVSSHLGGLFTGMLVGAVICLFFGKYLFKVIVAPYTSAMETANLDPRFLVI